jgi:hypothetical protein
VLIQYPAMNTSFYDVHKTFLRSLSVHDIAEPLPSFDSITPAAEARSGMLVGRHAVAGVRQGGFVSGYIEYEALGDGLCGDYTRAFDEESVIADSASLTDVVLKLDRFSRLFVRSLGTVAGLVTRADLQDPPVRMWLFGMITVLEMRFLELIEARFSDESWGRYISPARREKALELMAERRRRGQDARLLDCLQFSDKAQIVVRDETLRSQAGIVSRGRGDEVIKSLERLRNDLAHTQDIIVFDWQTIVAITENLERLIAFGASVHS